MFQVEKTPCRKVSRFRAWSNMGFSFRRICLFPHSYEVTKKNGVCGEWVPLMKFLHAAWRKVLFHLAVEWCQIV